MAVVRWTARKGAAEGSWLGRMMAKKPRLLVAIALANKMARSVWATVFRVGSYPYEPRATSISRTETALAWIFADGPPG